MGLIVCATRGGEAGRRTQERAIALAKEREDELVFLAVFDPTFAGDLSDVLAEAVVQEQRWLGRALTSVAQSRALKQGVHAHAEVRNGRVLEGIENFLRESCASMLVIGEPKVDSPLGTFKQGGVQSCAEQMVDKVGIDVEVVTPE
jgi:nucleotide-binding universal stress UspA family protein